MSRVQCSLNMHLHEEYKMCVCVCVNVYIKYINIYIYIDTYNCMYTLLYRHIMLGSVMCLDSFDPHTDWQFLVSSLLEINP